MSENVDNTAEFESVDLPALNAVRLLQWATGPVSMINWPTENKTEGVFPIDGLLLIRGQIAETGEHCLTMISSVDLDKIEAAGILNAMLDNLLQRGMRGQA